MNKQHHIFILVGNRSEEIVDRGLPHNKKEKGM